MKKESKRMGFPSEKSRELEPSLHDLYFTEDIDIEEELRLMEADPRVKDVTGDPGTLHKIKAEWAKMNGDVEMSEELSPVVGDGAKKDSSDVIDIVSQEELSKLSPEARELVELGMKVKSEECDDEPKVRVIRKRSKRIFFAVAAILVMSMAVGTTGVTSLYKYLQVEEKGTEEQFRYLDSEEEVVVPRFHVNESEIYQQVDKFFGAPVVKLYGDIAGLDFNEVLFHDEDMSVDLVYYSNNKSFFYSIQSNYNQLSSMSFMEEDLIETEMFLINDVAFKVDKYNIDNGGYFNYQVSYNYNGLFYKIVARELQEGVIFEILKKLHF